MLERLLAGEPGRVGLLDLELVGNDPLIDLVPVCRVVVDRGLEEMHRPLEVFSGRGDVAVVVAHHEDGFPDIKAGAKQGRAPTGGAVDEVNERMLLVA